MNTPIFTPITKIIEVRRPQWTINIEDNLLRINTMQFAVDWPIIKEMEELPDFILDQCIFHQSLGLVVCFRYTGGT